MSYSLQEFLANSAIKAAHQLSTAYSLLPEEKRNWKPSESSRTAQDQVIECAILNAMTISMIANYAMPEDGFAIYRQEQEAAGKLDSEALIAQLTSSAANVAEAIRLVPDEVLRQEVSLPWGNQPVAEVIAFPYWNMSYHNGQISYVASLLGLLK